MVSASTMDACLGLDKSMFTGRPTVTLTVLLLCKKSLYAYVTLVDCSMTFFYNLLAGLRWTGRENLHLLDLLTIGVWKGRFGPEMVENLLRSLAACVGQWRGSVNFPDLKS